MWDFFQPEQDAYPVMPPRRLRPAAVAPQRPSFHLHALVQGQDPNQLPNPNELPGQQGQPAGRKPFFATFFGEGAFSIYLSVAWVFAVLTFVANEQHEAMKLAMFFNFIVLILAMIGLVTHVRAYILPFTLCCVLWISGIVFIGYLAYLKNLDYDFYKTNICVGEGLLKICKMIDAADSVVLGIFLVVLLFVFTVFFISGFNVFLTMPLEELLPVHMQFPVGLQEQLGPLYRYHLQNPAMAPQNRDVGAVNPDSPPPYSTLEHHAVSVETSPPHYSHWEKMRPSEKDSSTTTTTAHSEITTCRSTNSVTLSSKHKN